MEFGIHGNANLVLLDHTSKPVLFLPQVLFSNIDFQGAYVDASGGQQNMQLMGWSESATANFAIHTPIFSMRLLEIASGSLLNRVSQTVHSIDIIELDLENKGKLDFLPLDNKPFFVFELNPSGKQVASEIQSDDYSMDDKEITITKQLAGDWILVYYYYTSEVDMVEIGKFMNKGYFTIVGETVVHNKETGEEVLLKFEFPKVSIKNHFDLDMLNANNPDQVFIIVCSAVVEGSKDKVLARIFTPIDE